MYTALGCLEDGTNKSLTKSLMFQVLFFFILFKKLRALKTLYFCNFIKKRKINWKDFCKEFCKKSWKKNAWNIGRLVNDLFVPSSKRSIVLYCKLTDFFTCISFSTGWCWLLCILGSTDSLVKFQSSYRKWHILQMFNQLHCKILIRGR